MLTFLHNEVLAGALSCGCSSYRRKVGAVVSHPLFFCRARTRRTDQNTENEGRKGQREKGQEIFRTRSGERTNLWRQREKDWLIQRGPRSREASGDAVNGLRPLPFLCACKDEAEALTRDSRRRYRVLCFDRIDSWNSTEFFNKGWTPIPLGCFQQQQLIFSGSKHFLPLLSRPLHFRS